MSKSSNVVPLRAGIQSSDSPSDSPGSSDVWVGVGRRLEQRRTQLGYSAEQVALWAGLSVEHYEGCERGAPIPASPLAQIAELLDSPITWFFEGASHAAPSNDNGGQADATPDFQVATFTVATVEHRIQALAETFRKLDFEGQQHLLALSEALSRSTPRAVRG